jgi:hypothetical protein
MRNLIWTSLGILMAVFIGGCAAFEDPSQRATENAESTIVAKTISAVDIQVETVNALKLTADGAAQLTSNLTAAFVERGHLQETIDVMRGVNPGITVGGSTPVPLFAGSPTALDGGPAAGQGPSPSPGSQAIYTNPVTTTQVDANFCAIQSETSFTMDTELIYFVVTVQNLPQNVSFSMRVNRDGEPTPLDEDVNFWVSDGHYDRTCIYYGLDSNNFPFVAGSYRVTLLANGEGVATTEVFTIN